MVFTADRARTVLGISVGERSLLVAQVGAGGASSPGPRVCRIAEFAYPSGVSIDDGEALGAALRAFLRAGGFAAGRAVLGVPAKWLMLRTHRIPPADESTAADLLRLQVESHGTPELGEMVYDFAGDGSADEPCDVLVMGLPRRRLDALLAMAGAARLKVVAVTPCTAALCAATSAGRAGRPLVLSVRPEGAELAAALGSRPRFLRHLGSAVAAPPLGVELRRAAAMLPAEFTSGNGHDGDAFGPEDHTPREMIIWDDVGLDPDALASLEASLGFPVVRGELPALGGSGCALADGRVGGRAVALALPFLAGQRPAIDFLHPRLVAPKESRLQRRTVWITAAATAAALAIVLGYADLVRLQRQVERVNGDLQAIDPALRVAKPFVARMQFAEAFHGDQPRCLECLRDMTAALPENGQTYLTSFHLQNTMQGEFAGHAASVPEVIGVVDKLNAGGRFSELKRTFDARGTTPGVSFKVTFVYFPRR
ncbi:MAG TPA: hypothetical protein VGI81_20840 [Tepidisphaeraceae bacterium]